VAIDLAIVVVGVFLGIQASNWNEDRHNRRIAGTYLDRIRRDLASDVDQLRQHEDYWHASADAGDRALQFAENGRLDRNEWTTLLDFYDAAQIWNYVSNDATYNEMLSAGRLDLLHDSDLKAGLGEYYVGTRSNAHVLFDTLPSYRENIRATVPYRFQRYILERCKSDAWEEFRGGDCPPPPDTNGLAALNRSIAANTTLIGELTKQMTNLHYTRNAGIEKQQEAQRLIGGIDAERR